MWKLINTFISISRNKSNTTRGLIFVCFLPNVNSQQPFNTSNLDRTLSIQPKKSDTLHWIEISFILPVWRPLRLAAFLNWTRAREWTTVGFLMIKPSDFRRRMLRRELANAISFVSFGSNQILRFPHFNTDAARRFCKRRLAVSKICCCCWMF